MMKKIVLITASILMTVSCHVDKQAKLSDTQQLSPDGIETFYATAEGNTSESKTYIDENLQVRWNAGDCISVFNRNTYNALYRFNGEDGDIEGRFERVRTAQPSYYPVGSELDHIYAVYPYRADTKINRAGTTITMTLPVEQSYREHSFGPGANAAVALSDDESLAFRNVGGYLVLRLYGDDVRVSRITIQGNNHEKISGKARIAVGLNTLPTVTMDESASEFLFNVCATPVLLGDSSENYTDFWFVLPPITFRRGFTITVTDEYGCSFTQTISDRIIVRQNTIVWTSPIQVVPNYNKMYVKFIDPNFKAYCVENFDNDGDGEISISEALLVTTIDINTDNISCLEGIMSFGNLENLTARGSAGAWLGNEIGGSDTWGNISLLQPFPTNLEPGTVIATGKLSGVNLAHHNKVRNVTIIANTPMGFINLSDCPSLEHVTVLFCGISEINVSNDTALTNFFCYSNQLTALDVSSNVALRWLKCGRNQLTSLDVSNNTALLELCCMLNSLTTLDLSNNTALTTLSCSVNQLTALDVSNNTALAELDCERNQLTALDVSNNLALRSLLCFFNQLTTLDVSNNSTLMQLWCYGNPHLTELWLQAGQIIPDLQYDRNVTRIYYRRLGNNTTSKKHH